MLLRLLNKTVRPSALKIAGSAAQPSYALDNGLPEHGLTQISLCPSYSKSGRAIRAFLARQQSPGSRSSIEHVLTLPDNSDQYLMGRKRQAFRTNIRKCDQLGLSAERAPPDRLVSEVKLAISSNAEISHLPALLAERHASGFEDWIGYDQDMNAIGFARLKIDFDVALLTFLTAIRNDERSIVRYRISAEIFMSLASRGVRHVILFYGGPREDVNVYFAERLGFAMTEVTIVPPTGSTLLRTFFPKVVTDKPGFPGSTYSDRASQRSG